MTHELFLCVTGQVDSVFLVFLELQRVDINQPIIQKRQQTTEPLSAASLLPGTMHCLRTQ